MQEMGYPMKKIKTRIKIFYNENGIKRYRAQYRWYLIWRNIPSEFKSGWHVSAYGTHSIEMAEEIIEGWIRELKYRQGIKTKSKTKPDYVSKKVWNILD